MVFIRALTEAALSIFLLFFWIGIGHRSGLPYEVDGGPGFRGVFSTSNCPVGSGGSFCSAGRLPNIPSEVPSPDQFFY